MNENHIENFHVPTTTAYQLKGRQQRWASKHNLISDFFVLNILKNTNIKISCSLCLWERCVLCGQILHVYKLSQFLFQIWWGRFIMLFCCWAMYTSYRFDMKFVWIHCFYTQLALYSVSIIKLSPFIFFTTTQPTRQRLKRRTIFAYQHNVALSLSYSLARLIISYVFYQV